MPAPALVPTVAICLVLCVLTGSAPAQGRPHQATGFKVGEVTDSSAIVWTRLTAKPARNPEAGPMVAFHYRNDERTGRPTRRVERLEFPDGSTVADLRGGAPGCPGQVRVGYRPEGEKAWTFTAWRAVDPARDFTRQLPLDGLAPGTRYAVRVESRAGEGGAAGSALSGRFRTAPPADRAERVVFAVSTGQRYPHRDGPHGFDIYPAILELDPHFFVHTGDIVYYDRLAKNVELARYHWQRTYSLPSNFAFHRRVASYFIKDDHDTLVNDCWPSMQSPYMHEMTFALGQAVFREQVPIGERTWRRRRWGADLEIWLVEGRDFRSPNTAPDGPDKTIWGAEQKRWFEETLAASEATFKVLISPTPMVGPDRANKHDNHANEDFRHEGDELRRFLGNQRNTLVVCGDRHWQYASVDPATGVREYSCGPASDAHAGGWQQSDFVESHHRYLNVIGGFLSVTVERIGGRPTLTVRFHDSNGEVRYEDRIVAEG